jgi:hypothetical protein
MLTKMKAAPSMTPAEHDSVSVSAHEDDHV